MKALAILAVLLVASCAGRPAFAQPAPRCGNLTNFVLALQSMKFDHVVLRGEPLRNIINFLDGVPGLDIVTVDPDSAIVATTNPEGEQAMVALVKGDMICDRIAVPMQLARQFMAGV